MDDLIRRARDLVPAMADRIEAQEALLKEAMAWLADFAEAKFDAVRTHRTSHPADEPDPVTDAETVWAYQDDARVTLAKLRAHLEDKP